jgi:hypothetical protein
LGVGDFGLRNIKTVDVDLVRGTFMIVGVVFVGTHGKVGTGYPHHSVDGLLIRTRRKNEYY